MTAALLTGLGGLVLGIGIGFALAVRLVARTEEPDEGTLVVKRGYPPKDDKP